MGQTNFQSLWEQNPQYLNIGNEKLKIIRNSDWIYESEISNFRIEYSLLENNILHSQNSGYTEISDIHQTFKLLDKILQETGIPIQELDRITEVSGLKGGSIFARKVANDYFNREKYGIKAMYLYGVTPYTKVLYKFIKLLNPAKYNNWIICKNLEETLELIQNSIFDSKSYKAMTDSAGVNPLPEDVESLQKMVLSLKKKHQSQGKYFHNKIEQIVESIGKISWALNLEGEEVPVKGTKIKLQIPL